MSFWVTITRDRVRRRRCAHVRWGKAGVARPKARSVRRLLYDQRSRGKRTYPWSEKLRPSEGLDLW